MKKIIWAIIITLIILGGIFFIKNNSQNKKKQVDSKENKLEEQIQYENNYNQDENTTEEDENTTEESVETVKSNVIEEDSNKNKSEKDNANKDTEKKLEDNINTVSIKEKLSPTGFMGSSLLKVAIYSNGEVYLLKYDGEGYEDSNLIEKELIATNASFIYSKGAGEDFEAIVVKGNSSTQVKSNNYSWIEFEK